jgi:hypothetical protein
MKATIIINRWNNDSDYKIVSSIALCGWFSSNFPATNCSSVNS